MNTKLYTVKQEDCEHLYEDASDTRYCIDCGKNIVTQQKTKKEIERLYVKWSESGLNEYEKIALKHLEKRYKTL